MKLFGHDTSPYVRRIRVLLAEKGLPFSRDDHGWVDATDEMLRINPLMKVPFLVDEQAGGQVVIDSKLIATYLYDRYRDDRHRDPPASSSEPSGHPQLPLQATLYRPSRRYDDENVLLAIDGATDSAINVFLLEMDGVPRTASPYLQRQEQRIAKCMAWLDGLYADEATPKVTLDGGSTLSFTDIALMCSLEWMAFRKRYDWSQHENLRSFVARHANRPSLSDTHPSKATNQAPPNTKAASSKA